MFKFHYIHEFVTLANTLSFSKAAELCFITQPALSRHIAILEEELGEKLFVRTTRSTQLTPAGEIVLQSFQDILQTYNQTKEEVTFLSKGKIGSIRLSIPYYWFEDYGEPLIRHFNQNNQDCEVITTSCQPKDGLQAVYDSTSDMTITSAIPNPTQDVRYFHFANEPLAIACHKEHPLAKRSTCSLAETNGYPIIMMKSPDSEFNEYGSFVIQLLSKRGIYPQVIHYMQQIDTLGLTIEQTNGICIVPYGIRHMNRSYLHFIPIIDEDCYIKMCLYYRTDNNNSLIFKLIQEANVNDTMKMYI